MTSDEIEKALLEFLRRPDYRPVKPSVLTRQMGLGDERRPDLKRVLKRLVKRGRVAYGPNHLVLGAAAEAEAAPSPEADGNGKSAKTKKSKKAKKREEAKKNAKSDDPTRVTGVFRRARGGFGFVRPSGNTARDRKADIYIPANAAGDAASGDDVLVRVGTKRGRFGCLSGSILEIIERETHQFVGTYFESAGMAMVQVDGTVFARPVGVGDPGAKNANPGDKVVFEMVRFPSHAHDGEGVITKVLGPRGAPGVDTQSIIHEFNLPEEFSEAALDVARAELDRFDGTVPPDRSDWTEMTIITIDPATARDFDDAVSLERLEEGHWRLGVHIADVSHFVRPGTPLDREAYDRATSVYLPDRVLPMLPETISNGVASLQPDKVRFVKSAFIEFTADGAQVAVELGQGAIRSKRRFTYEEVDEYLADREGWKSKLKPDVHRLLGDMHELAMILRRRRFKRGALELTMPEIQIDLDRHGRVAGAHLAENTESHQMIEEFMLAANEGVAEKLKSAEILFLRRIHGSPSPAKLKALKEFVTELGFEVDGLESRFALQKLLNEVADRPERHAVNYAVLRSLERAVYGPADEGHYALASECYCHFTSPIRRYPDLTIHRLVERLLTGRKVKNDLDALIVAGEHCSQREQRAEVAERELTKVKLLNYLSERIGEEMDAVITGVEEFGLFVQGTALPAEGLIHVTSLEDDYYHYDKATHSLAGRRAGNAFRLGDLVRVAVARVDVDRRELDFRLAARPEQAPNRRRAAKVPPPRRPDRGRGPKATGRKSGPPKRKKRRR